MTKADPELEVLLSGQDVKTCEYGVLGEPGASVVVVRRESSGVHAMLIEDQDLAERMAAHVLERGAKRVENLEDLGWTTSDAVVTHVLPETIPSRS